MPNQFTNDEYETHEDDDSERFDEPIKVTWTGYARSRISEYNSDFDEDNAGDGALSPERFLLAVGRLKTKVVCVTPEEAAAVRYESDNYDSDQRVWMNSAQDRSLGLLASRLDQEMAERGYEPVYTGHGSFRNYYPADEAGEVQERIDHERREFERRRNERRQKTMEIYSEVRDLGAKSHWSHSGEAKIVFHRGADRDGPETAARLFRKAGCDNVSIEETEHTEHRMMNDEAERYTTWEVTGDIPESGYGLD